MKIWRLILTKKLLHENFYHKIASITKFYANYDIACDSVYVYLERDNQLLSCYDVHVSNLRRYSMRMV